MWPPHPARDRRHARSGNDTRHSSGCFRWCRECRPVVAAPSSARPPAGKAPSCRKVPGRKQKPDDRLAFASDRALSGKMALYLLAGAPTTVPRPLGDIPGTIENIRWSAECRSLIVHAADRGLDAAATSGAMRLAWGNEEDPAVTNPTEARRRLYRVE